MNLIQLQYNSIINTVKYTANVLTTILGIKQEKFTIINIKLNI